MIYSRKNLIYLKQDKIRKSKIFTTFEKIHRSFINNLKSDETKRKPDKGNGVVILDRKIYGNAIQELISDTSKFEKLNEDPTLKREASLQRFLRNLKQKKL